MNEASKKVVIRHDVTFNEANFEDMKEPAIVRSSAMLEKALSKSVTSGEAEVSRMTDKATNQVWGR